MNRVFWFKYLGHIIIEDLRDNVERERRALLVRGNILADRFSHCSVDVLSALFRVCCQNVCTGALWTNYTLRLIHNNIFRILLLRLLCFCSATGMFADACVDNFYATMCRNSTSLILRLRRSFNSFLKMIAGKMVFRRFTMPTTIYCYYSLNFY